MSIFKHSFDGSNSAVQLPRNAVGFVSLRIVIKQCLEFAQSAFHKLMEVKSTCHSIIA